MLPLFTASRLDTIFRCPGAATLPYVEERERNPAFALAGTEEHARLLGENLPQNLRDWLRADTADAPIFEQSFTVDFAADPPISRVSDYSAVSSPTISGGTPDAYALTRTKEGLILRVPDLKTGVGHAGGSLPQPGDSWQLRYYALAVLLSHHWPASESLVQCTVAWWIRDFEAECYAQPDVPPEEREHIWTIREAVLPESLLLESIDRLRELTTQLSQHPASIWREGSWCESCSAFRACPVQRSPVERLGIALDTATTILTEEHAAAVASALPSVRALLEQSERFLERYVASQGPIRLQSGRLLSRERLVRKRITPLALPILSKEYPEAYPAMVRHSTNLTQIAHALGEQVPGSKTREVLRLLRTVPGAVEENSTFSLRERKGES